jgi:hypothetical protein
MRYASPQDSACGVADLLGDRSGRELRELVVRLAVPRSLEGMVATICCLRIQMAIGSLFMKRVEDMVVNKGI